MVSLSSGAGRAATSGPTPSTDGLPATTVPELSTIGTSASSPPTTREAGSQQHRLGAAPRRLRPAVERRLSANGGAHGQEQHEQRGSYDQYDRHDACRDERRPSTRSSDREPRHLRAPSDSPCLSRSGSSPIERRIDLAPQVSDVDLDHVVIADVVRVPHVAQDVGLRHHLATMPHQVLQQTELARRQGDLDVAAPNPGDEGSASGHRRRAPSAAPESRVARAHAGVPQHPEGERLGQVVVRAEVECIDLVELTVLRGQHQDRVQTSARRTLGRRRSR